MGSSRQRLHVILVEDDPGMATAVARVLALLGIAVTRFASAEEFLEHYGDDEAQCYVFDIHLPRMTGLELQRELHALHSHVPVVMITADSDDSLRAIAQRDGAHAVLVKPFDIRDLAAVVRRAAGSPP